MAENRGGARRGSGPKPRKRPEYSERARQRLWKAIAKVAKEEGRDPFELLALTAIQRKNDELDNASHPRAQTPT